MSHGNQFQSNNVNFEQDMPIFKSKKMKSKKVPIRAAKGKKGPSKAYQKKFVDIEQALGDDSEDEMPKPNIRRNETNEGQDRVMPLPGSPVKLVGPRNPNKKASNIKTKKMRKPNINSQSTYNSNSNSDDYNNSYGRQFSRA